MEQLFTDSTGEPMLFEIGVSFPGRQELVEAITNCGGLCTEKNNPLALLILDSSNKLHQGYYSERSYSVNFVIDSMREKVLKDVSLYKLTRKDNVQPQSSKSPLLQKSKSHIENLKKDTAFVNVDDDLKMALYVLANPGTAEKGNVLWQQAEAHDICNHSWQSMQSHWAKMDPSKKERIKEEAKKIKISIENQTSEVKSADSIQEKVSLNNGFIHPLPLISLGKRPHEETTTNVRYESAEISIKKLDSASENNSGNNSWLTKVSNFCVLNEKEIKILGDTSTNFNIILQRNNAYKKLAFSIAHEIGENCTPILVLWALSIHSGQISRTKKHLTSLLRINSGFVEENRDEYVLMEKLAWNDEKDSEITSSDPKIVAYAKKKYGEDDINCRLKFLNDCADNSQELLN